MNIRIGFGFDFHPLVEGRKCILGGIEIAHHKGLKGHSDADVLLHAITDALLGSLALGDIGTHFPDDSTEWKGADSKKLLSLSYEKVTERGFVIQNIDATVIAEKPRLNRHINAIRHSISSLLSIDLNQVSVKATTHEKLGPVGREEGIACHAVVLIKSE